MKIVCHRMPGIVLLLCGIAANAYAPAERIMFVEPPLRILTQCEFREIRSGKLTCSQDGWPRDIAVAATTPMWKGKDFSDLRGLTPGDLLDIKLGIDSDSHDVALFIWANLVSLEGVLGRPAGSRWFLVHPLIPFSIGKVSDEPIFAWVDNSTSILGGSGTGAMRQGVPVIVIGERLDARRIRATRIALSTR